MNRFLSTVVRIVAAPVALMLVVSGSAPARAQTAPASTALVSSHGQAQLSGLYIYATTRTDLALALRIVMSDGFVPQSNPLYGYVPELGGYGWYQFIG